MHRVDAFDSLIEILLGIHDMLHDPLFPFVVWHNKLDARTEGLRSHA